MKKIENKTKMCYYLNAKEDDKMNNYMQMTNILTCNLSKNGSKSNIFSYLFQAAKTYIDVKKRIKSLNLDYSKTIVQDKEILSGKPTIINTRITPKMLYNKTILLMKENNFTEGDNLDKILDDVLRRYPTISKEQYIIAIAYYLEKRTMFDTFRK